MCVNATVKIITMEGKTNDLTEILTQAINKIKMRQGEKFELDKINLAELERLTGITRAKLRRLKENGFVEKPHGLLGRKADRTVLTGYTGIVDTLLKAGITNSSVCFDRLKEAGYQGGLTTVKTYIAEHQDLIPEYSGAFSITNPVLRNHDSGERKSANTWYSMRLDLSRLQAPPVAARP